MTVANLSIVFGTMFIAIGGIMATHGWNAKTVASQKNGIIRAVAAETIVNIAILNDPIFTAKNDKELLKFTMFPRTQTAALEGAIASGLFIEDKDRIFLTRAVGLNELLNSFNQRLDFTENRLSQKPNEIALYRKKLREGQFRKSVSVKLQKLGNLLISNYGIKHDDSFFVELGD